MYMEVVSLDLRVAAHMRARRSQGQIQGMLLSAGYPRRLRKQPQGLLNFHFLTNFNSSKNFEDALPFSLELQLENDQNPPLTNSFRACSGGEP
jgi:hypothetical protein